MKTRTWSALAAAQVLALVALALTRPDVEEPPAAPGEAPRDDAVSTAPKAGQGQAEAELDIRQQPTQRREITATEPHRYDATSPIGLIVTGTVRDEAGELLEGATVRFTARSAPPAGVEFHPYSYLTFHGAQTDVNGFHVVGLWPGDWKAFATAPGMRWEERRVQLAVEPARSELEFVLSPQPEDCRVFLVDESGSAWTPDKDTILTLVCRPTPVPDRVERAACWSGEGIWRAPAPDSEEFARLTTRSDLPLHLGIACGEAVIARAVWSEHGQELRIRLDPEQVRASLATLRVQVQDAETGRELPEAHVEVGQVAYPRDVAGIRRKDATTDARGLATIAGLRPGRVILFVAAEGYATDRSTPVLSSGDERTLRIGLHRARKITGRVLSATGSPDQFAFVLAVPLDRCHEPPSFWDEWFGGGGHGTEQGRFELDCGSGKHLILARRWEDGCATAVVDTTAGAVEDLTLQLVGATKVPVVARGARYLVLRGPDGLPINWAKVGHMSSDNLYGPPGTWTLESWSSIGLVESFEVTLPIPAWQEIELR